MDDDETQQFSLRWHNHQNSVIGALGHMLNTGALSDVTLSASGACLRAHRVILAACSQYFAQIFKEVECGNNSVVVVVGCEAAELRLLLTFMYTGEVTAERRRLPALLRLAHTLQVKGLTDSHTNSTVTRTGSESNNEPISPLNLEKPEPLFPEDTRTDVEKEPEYLNEMAARGEKDKLSKLDQIVQNLYTTHKLGSIAATAPPPMLPNIGGDVGESDRRWRGGGSVCGVCNKRLSNQYNLRVHMDTHAGRRHACRACSHVSRSRDALRKHVAYRHAPREERPQH